MTGLSTSRLERPHYGYGHRSPVRSRRIAEGLGVAHLSHALLRHAQHIPWADGFH